MLEKNLLNLLTYLPCNFLCHTDKIYAEACESIVFLFNLSYCYIHCVGLIGKIIELCQHKRRDAFCEGLKHYVSKQQGGRGISEHN